MRTTAGIAAAAVALAGVAAIIHFGQSRDEDTDRGGGESLPSAAPPQATGPARAPDDDAARRDRAGGADAAVPAVAATVPTAQPPGYVREPAETGSSAEGTGHAGEPVAGAPQKEPEAAMLSGNPAPAAETASPAAGASDADRPDASRARVAVDARQGLFKLMGWSMEPLGAMLRNRVPFDAETVSSRAARLGHLARMIPDLFEHDTRQSAVPSAARAGAWDNRSDFVEKSEVLVGAAASLGTAAGTGDRAATLRAVGAVGQACGACHDAYRDD